METSVTTPKKRILAGQYEILEIVGRGASSVVYRARYLERDQSELAIKVLLNKDDLGAAANRLRKEASAMVAARHKYILRLDDFHSLESLHYLTMELAQFSDLRKYLQGLGRTLSAAEAERYFRQMTEALSFVHNVGIIHRDIKPDNILVINDRQLRLGDFSASLLPGEKSSLEELQRGIGSLDYLAPEVLRGETFGTFSDVYSLGLTFYECLTGTNPLAEVPIVDMLTAREDENFAPVLTYCPDLNRGLAAIIMKCISFDPANRFKSGSEILKALESNDQALNFTSPSAALQELRNEVEQPEASDPFDQEIQDLLDAAPREDIPSEFAEYQPSVAEELPESTEELAQQNQMEAYDDESDGPDFFSQVPPALHAKSDQAEQRQNQYQPTVTDDLTETGNSSSFTKSAPGRENQLFNFKQNELAKTERSINTRKSFIVGLITISLVLLLAYKLIAMIFSSFGAGSTEAYFQKFAGGTITFPNLPEGSYAGKISNLIPNQETAIVLFSYPEAGQLKLIIGLPGLDAQLFDYNALGALDQNGQPSPLIIRQGGYLLELRAEATEPKITGSYVNLITQQKGTWELLPVKE